MRRIAVVACATGVFCLGGVLPARAQAARPRVVLVMAPEGQVRRFLDSHLAAIGVGVFPDSREVPRFLQEIGAGAPIGYGRPTANQGLGALDDLLRGHGIEVVHTPTTFKGSNSAPELPVRGSFETVRLFGSGSATIESATSAASEAIVLGLGGRTPVTVALLGSQGVLYARDTNRLGVVTPYDITATILRAFDIAVPTSVAGVPLQVRADPQPQQRVDALAARFVRDAGYGPGEAGAFAGLALAGALLGVLLARRKPRLAGRFARGAATIPLGHAAAFFVPSGAWEVRALPLVAGFALGALLPSKDDRRFCGIVLLAGAAALGALTIASALRPNGEPALSFWGDPLVSWRFFGVRNHIMAFLSAGALVGASLLQLGDIAYVAIAVVAGVLVGAPKLGANYIGVTVLAFAAAIGIVARAVKRVAWWQWVPAAAVAAIATVGALLSDTGQVSHGGRAVHSVNAHGLRAAWEIVRARAALDYHEVARIGIPGYLGFAATTGAVIFLIVRARSLGDLPLRIRAGIFGVAGAALIALFIEDSGFFTGGNLLLAPAIAFAVARAATAPASEPQPGAG